MLDSSHPDVLPRIGGSCSSWYASSRLFPAVRKLCFVDEHGRCLMDPNWVRCENGPPALPIASPAPPSPSSPPPSPTSPSPPSLPPPSSSPAPPPTSPPHAPLVVACSNDCVGASYEYTYQGFHYLANNGVCEDGGEDAAIDAQTGDRSDSCELGSDCADCGPRTIALLPPPHAPPDPPAPPSPMPPPPAAPPPPPPAPLPPQPARLCSNVCAGTDYSYTYGGHHWRASNGVCEDGGEGSGSEHCQLGTDCADCGDRVVATAPPPPPAPRPPPPRPPPPTPRFPGCSNMCNAATYEYHYNDHHWLASNGVCEDGGAGAQASICDLGACASACACARAVHYLECCPL